MLWFCLFQEKYFPFHSLGSWWDFANIRRFPLHPIVSLTSVCFPTWKNVSTCCLGASSLRTGYVHLPIMSYIAFIMSSISWKVKDTHVRLHAMCGETALRNFDTSFLLDFEFVIVPSSLKAFCLSLRKIQPLRSWKAAESKWKNHSWSLFQNEVNSHIFNIIRKAHSGLMFEFP